MPGRVIVAVGGGAAAIKAPFLLRRLREAGYEVRAAASDDAYQFVTRLSLSLAAGERVLDREAWFEPSGRALHLEWAAWADLLLIAPATADALASAAHGHAEDVVSALALGGPTRVAWAPAMNQRMWRQPAVQRNVETLRGYGHEFIGPSSGDMAAVGETAGVGRMSEPEEIVEHVRVLLGPRDLRGRRILVSAGPTREYLDPVRFLSNPSSGRMGYAVARAAARRGAEVTLVSGPSSLPAPSGVELLPVTSAEEMLAALSTPFTHADALVMTAAVADWRGAQVLAHKEPKSGERRTLELVRTPDILETLAASRRGQILVGFAMETDAGVERAAEKARRKGLDFICLNYPTREGSAFGGPDNQVTIVSADGSSEELPRMSKDALANLLLDRVAGLIARRDRQ